MKLWEFLLNLGAAGLFLALLVKAWCVGSWRQTTLRFEQWKTITLQENTK